MNLIELIYAYRQHVRDRGKSSADRWLVSTGASKEIRDELSICVDNLGDFVDFEGNLYAPEEAEMKRQAYEASLDSPD